MDGGRQHRAGASFTIAKLRWLAEFEPAHARRIGPGLLPHDWLVWRLRLAGTGRGPPGGAGPVPPTAATPPAPATAPRRQYRQDLIKLALGHELTACPGSPAPAEPAGETPGGPADLGRHG